MDVVINTKISLMMETVDLVSAYVNRVPPAALTSDKPYCVSAREVERIMNLVCGDLNRDDPKLQFYFRGYVCHSAVSEKAPISCVASVLIFSSLNTNECDLQRARAIMHSSHLGGGSSYKINSFFRGFGIEVSSDYISLADELKNIDLPDDFRLQLAVALSNYHYHIDQICDLLEPLALRLLPLLEPVAERAEPWAQLWREALGTEEGQRNFLSRINAKTDTVRQLEIGMRIFYPMHSKGSCEVEDGRFYCGAGLELMPQKEEKTEPSFRSSMAMQLLCSVDRLRMLRAMSGRVLEPKDIARELNINRGTVFRDLNNLLQAGLVQMVTTGTHRSYTTHKENLESVIQQMLRIVRDGDDAR